MSDDGATLLKVMITAVLSSPLCYAHRSAMLTTMLLQASAALPCLQLCYDTAMLFGAPLLTVML